MSTLVERVLAASGHYKPLRAELDELATVSGDLADARHRIHTLQARITEARTLGSIDDGTVTPTSMVRAPSQCSVSRQPSASSGFDPDCFSDGPKSPGITAGSRTLEATMRKLGSAARKAAAVIPARARKESATSAICDQSSAETVQPRASIVRDLELELERLVPYMDRLHAEDLRRIQLLNAVSSILNFVFDGPTPDEPQDDHLELDLRRAESDLAFYKPRYKTEQLTLSVINEALSCVKSLFDVLEEIRKRVVLEDFSAPLVWSAGHSRNSGDGTPLQRAQKKAQDKCDRIQKLFEKARRMNAAVVSPVPALLPLPAPQCPSQSAAGKFPLVVCESIQDFKDTIQTWTAQAERERTRAQNRYETARSELHNASEAARLARRALFNFRQATFEDILVHHGFRSSADSSIIISARVPSFATAPSESSFASRLTPPGSFIDDENDNDEDEHEYGPSSDNGAAEEFDVLDALATESDPTHPLRSQRSFGVFPQVPPAAPRRSDLTVITESSGTPSFVRRPPEHFHQSAGGASSVIDDWDNSTFGHGVVSAVSRKPSRSRLDEGGQQSGWF